MKKIFLLLSVIFFPFLGSAQVQHHEQKPEDPFRLQKLTESVYALYGRGGNIGFFIGPDAVVVIDSQYRDLAPGIVEKIKSVTEKPVRYLLNTHHHPDHVGGNEFFIRFAVIIAHDNVRKRVLASPGVILSDYPARLEEAKKEGKADAVKFFQDQIEWAKKVRVEEIAAPFLTFDSEFRIHLGGETIQVWHTPPAHTDGDAVVYFEKANAVHLGDLFFHKVIPFIDVKGGGSARGYLVAIDKVIGRVPANVTVIPGHGEVTDIAGLKLFRQHIQDIIDAAARARAEGKSKEQFLKEFDMPEVREWRGYKERFKMNAEAAYDEASR